MFVSGPAPMSSKVDLNTGIPQTQPTWNVSSGQGGSNWPHQRDDGSSVFFAKIGVFESLVVRMCGKGEGGSGSTDRSEFLFANQTPPPAAPSTSWSPLGGNNGQVPGGPRQFTNAVILPDASILLLGGSSPTNAPVLPLALYRQGIGWQQMSTSADSPTVRSYHASALLLPDGRVFVGGGDDRIRIVNGAITGKDYDIFVPHYLQGNPQRPSIVNITGPNVTMFTDSAGNAAFQFPNGQNNLTCIGDFLENPTKLDQVTKLVLLAPGSITHHSDMSARYVELTSGAIPGSNTDRSFNVPGNQILPRGFYMMFALNLANVPSVAMWVKIV